VKIGKRKDKGKQGKEKKKDRIKKMMGLDFSQG